MSSPIPPPAIQGYPQPNRLYMRAPAAPSRSDANRLASEVAAAFPGLSPAFTATTVGVFTWFAVGRYKKRVDLLNTFQVRGGEGWVANLRWGLLRRVHLHDLSIPQPNPCPRRLSWVTTRGGAPLWCVRTAAAAASVGCCCCHRTVPFPIASPPSPALPRRSATTTCPGTRRRTRTARVRRRQGGGSSSLQKCSRDVTPLQATMRTRASTPAWAVAVTPSPDPSLRATHRQGQAWGDGLR